MQVILLLFLKVVTEKGLSEGKDEDAPPATKNTDSHGNERRAAIATQNLIVFSSGAMYPRGPNDKNQ
jgi:hypothetical protein